MADTYQRLIKRAGGWDALRGNSGITGDVTQDRDKLVPGTYNPVDYSGSSRLGGDYNTNRVGFYGWDSLTHQEEGTNKTISTVGLVISNTVFYRRVTVSAANVVFVNCLFLGSPTENQPGLFSGSPGVNITYIDCTFTLMAPQWQGALIKVGVGGHTFIRCDMYGGMDGVSPSAVWTNPVVLNQCALHDMAFFGPDPGAAGGITDHSSHVDCVQMVGGKLYANGTGFYAFNDMTIYQANEPNLAFDGTGSSTTASGQNWLRMFGNKYTNTIARPALGRKPAEVIGQPDVHSTSCIMMSPVDGPMTGMKLENCYFDGSGFPINVSDEYSTDPAYGFTGLLEFNNNKVGSRRRWSTNNKVFNPMATALKAQVTVNNNTTEEGVALSRTQLGL